jgi:hypothetical protein
LLIKRCPVALVYLYENKIGIMLIMCSGFFPLINLTIKNKITIRMETINTEETK